MKFPLQPLYTWYRNILRNPKYRWWIIGGTLVYLLSPFDIAPDFFPLIGEIDDIAVVTLLFAELSQIAMDAVKKRSADGQDDATTVEATTVKTTTVEVDAVSMKD
jgi:uncharacterized membrane protein YkvA (DUF1232 family)